MSCLPWSLPSSGSLSSTAPSPTGLGDSTVGASSGASLTMLAAGRSRLGPEWEASPTPGSWVVVVSENSSTSDPITSPSSHSAPSCSGLDGSDSTLVLHSGPTCGRSPRLGTVAWQLHSPVSLGAWYACFGSTYGLTPGPDPPPQLDFRLQKKYTAVGLCSGTIAGLVAATPSSGYIPIWASIVLGIVSGAVCNYSTKIKHWVRIDDALDLFAEHAIGGIIGLLFNGLFAEARIIAMDGVSTTPSGGWLDHNWKQLYIQLAYVVACCAYVFFVTAALAKAMSYIPGLSLRADERAEVVGMDEDQVRLASYPLVLWLIMHDSSSSASLLKTSSKHGATSAPGLVEIQPPILLARGLPMDTSPLLVTATACRTLTRVDMSFTRRSLNYRKDLTTPRELTRRPLSFASTISRQGTRLKSSIVNHAMGLFRVLIAPPPLRLQHR